MASVKVKTFQLSSFSLFVPFIRMHVHFFFVFILWFVLYGCETWSLTLREESRLMVFENRILRRIFGPKRDENGEWRRLHDEVLHSLYSQGD